MSLQIYTSNRMEHLVEALAGVLADPLESAFTPEQIVVQSKGMQRWLAMELAKKFGVWANCKYPFPNKIVWDLFSNTLKGTPDVSNYSPETMTWKIMAILPRYLDREEFSSLNYYLNGDSDGLKRFQLAGKIADTFDQYTLFRPEMVLEWEEGSGADWQEILWRNMVACGANQHRARLKSEFISNLARSQSGQEALPERITVFGISYLPQYHLDILTEVARYTEVNLFLLSPCREYWGDIVSARDMVRRNPEESHYLEEGNPLLASLGKLARDFSNMVINSSDCEVTDLDLYADPGEGSLLSSLQSDMLNLRGAEGTQEAKKLIAIEDCSVQIHSCHSPMREIEVLHDNILALFERESGLTPRDIVVMTPDIETYAPYISMVFEACQDPARKIPYSIADRSLASEGVVAGVLLKLLGIPGSRLTTTSVFDILETPPVSRRFGLDAQEVEIIRSWIEDTRIRWGADEEHRASFGLPSFRENSWAAGLDRLILGYAMPEEGDQLFKGMLPFDEMEGNITPTLGKFSDFIQRVVRLNDDFARSRTLGDWRDALRSLLADFIAADDDTAFELTSIADIVDTFEGLSEKTGFIEKIDLVLICSWLSSRLDGEQKGFGFMTGGVTFCAMLPMRSIPFKVVALVGMSDNAFPRQSRPPGFDLISRNPLPGDRSLRDEDRYLFLESLLSARKYFYISYVGQSVKDNSLIPPSVLVSEFLDTIDRCFSAGEQKIEVRLVTRHRLQAFSKNYFDGTPGFFSYSDENFSALLEASESTRQQPKFISTPLQEPPKEMREVSLTQLVHFFSNPSKHLLENRLQLRLEDISSQLEEREPFEVAGLESYGLNQELLERRLKGGKDEDFLAIAKCRGLLPPARHGETVFAAASVEVGKLVATIGEETTGLEHLDPLYFEEVVGEFRLSGKLDGIWSEKKLSYRCAKLKAKDEIRLWIEHLALNAFAPVGYPRESVLVMKDAIVRYNQTDDAVDILGALLNRYLQGLRMPLRFFPSTSLEFASNGSNLDKARKKWESGFKYTGEEEDPYFRICFGREEDPLSDDFGQIALELLSPLITHRLKE